MTCEIRSWIFCWFTVVRSESLALSPLQFTLCCCHWGDWFSVSRNSEHQCLHCRVHTCIRFNDHHWPFIHGMFWMEMAVDHFQSWIASRLEHLSDLNNPWYDISTGHLLHFLGFLISVQVALERVKEYTEVKREPPEFIEPRPSLSWPSSGAIKCEDLVIRYAVGFLSLSLFNLVLKWFSPSCLLFFITSILKSIREKRLTWLIWWELELICSLYLDRYSRKNRVRKEHVGTVIL